MRVNVTGLRNKLHWTFSLEDGDGIYSENVTMTASKFFTMLPKGVTIDQVHPDHLALITLLVCHPFVNSSLTIPWKVSRRFSESCRLITKYDVLLLDEFVEPYNATENSRPALAFSGGADSTASLLVMPKNTLSVFMDRPLKKFASIYNKSAAYATIKHAMESGYDVQTLECDVEYMRKPLGFPTDLVPSIPILSLAASHDIDSIAFGTVMESAYRIGHEKSRDYKTSSHYRFWGRMFEAAGIPLYLPVAGVSEVGTSIIVSNSTFSDYTRSCIRGKWPNSCGNCWKCFRKNLIDARLNDKIIDDVYLEAGLKIPEVKKKIDSFPVSHENVLAWALKNASGKIVDVVMNRLEGSTRDLEFLKCYYQPSIDLLPKKYREVTKANLEKYLPRMDSKHFNSITEHTMTEWLSSDEAIQAKLVFDKFMNALS